MNGKTHSLIGISIGIATSQLLQTSIQDSIILTACCTIGALLPDIDYAHSTISKFIPLNPIPLFTSHRGILHHPAVPLIYFLIIHMYSWNLYTIMFGVGIILGHLVPDMLNPTGIPLTSKHDLYLLPKFLRIPTGGIREFAFQVVIGTIIIYQLGLNVYLQPIIENITQHV